MKIGIIGLGFVGGAVRNWFENYTDHQMFYYDKFKGIGSPEEVNNADIIFVAVPTPFRTPGGYDDAAVREAVSIIGDGRVVVIKSTVIPGTTANLQKENPRKTILFNPEFLRELTALDDFRYPERQIIGYADKIGKATAAPTVLRILPHALCGKMIGSTEAELVKYFSNVFLASKVLFANQMFDVCEAAGADYEVVREVASRDSRVGPSHLKVDDLGYRGYGGHCFPKDTRALRQYAQKLNVNTDFLDSMERINARLTGGIDR